MKIYKYLILLSTLFVSRCSTSQYQSICDTAFCRIVNDVSENVIPLKSIIKSGRRVEDLGAKADQICAAALSKFSAEVPPPTNAEGKAIYGKQMNKLEDVVETYLHPILLQQLDLLRKRSIDEFRRNLSLKGGHAAVVEAESIFLRGAEECVRRSSGAWSYDDSLQELHSAMADIASRNEELWDVKLDAARQVQKSLQYLQLQQQQIQAVRQQVQGFISPWDISAAYRIPGTNINLSILYQQGRANMQISCAPDESATVLGQNGFVNGISPGNVGVSCNINI